MLVKDIEGRLLSIPSEDEIEEIIKVRAYYKALMRNFEGNLQLQDWLDAEKEVYNYINNLLEIFSEVVNK
jgi:hypothetical protein